MTMLTEKISRRTEISLVLILFTFITFLLPYLPGHPFDTECWKNWAWHNHTNGLRHAYGSGSNYLPLYQYVLWAYGKLVGNSDHIGVYINYLRIFTLAIDLFGIWLVYRWTDKKWPFYLLAIFNLLNLGYVYNSIIWGQVDGILATLVFTAIYFAYRQKFIWSSAAMILALNFKLQGIVFVPIWGLVFLYQWADAKSWKKLLSSISVMLLLQVLILFPFLFVENGLKQIWQVVVNSVDTFPRVSMNAFNLWHLISPVDPWEITDDKHFFAGVSYKAAGLFLFFTTSLIALLPLLWKTWLKLKGKEANLSKEEVWLTSALIGLLFFFVNTQMHERYCHPAFIFVAAYSFYTGRFFAYMMFSVVYFLNLEKVLQALHWNNYSTWLFHPKVLAILYLLLICYLARELWRQSQTNRT